MNKIGASLFKKYKENPPPISRCCPKLLDNKKNTAINRKDDRKPFGIPYLKFQTDVGV